MKKVFRKSKGTLMEMAEEMLNSMSAEELLFELMEAMSGDELAENLEFIDRMNDLGVFDEDEDE